MGLILDSSVVIAAERRGDTPEQLVQQLIGAAGIIPFVDLLLGATALLLGFSILTVNPRHFKLVPGLNVISI
jgi:predicted nucleic acid-binding protein